MTSQPSFFRSVSAVRRMVLLSSMTMTFSPTRSPCAVGLSTAPPPERLFPYTAAANGRQRNALLLRVFLLDYVTHNPDTIHTTAAASGRADAAYRRRSTLRPG